MAYPNQISTGQSNAATVVNEELGTVAASACFGRKSSTTTGLTLGYYGGNFNETTVADGTVGPLTASQNNYIVVHRTTLAVTSATTTTNWDDTTTYGRLGKAVTSGSAITSFADERYSAGGIFDHAAAVAGSSVDLTSDVTGVLPLANGGTGVALADPNADRIMFWDDSAGSMAFLEAGAGLSISGATISTTATGGDASTNTATSVDSEVALFSGTGGKTLKRATGTGLAKLTSGVLSTATAGTDYYNPGGTDVAVADGGTGSSTAAGARSNLSAAGTSQTGEMMCGFIATPSNKDYRIVLNAAHGGTITEVTTRSASGTCTATFKINTTALGGTANSVSSTEQSQSHASSNVFAAGDDIVITVSSNSSCADMSFTIKYTRTLA